MKGQKMANNLVTKVVELVYQMDNDQLNQVMEAVQLKRNHITKQNIRNFLVGNIVSFEGRRGQASGQVVKINQKYVIVKESGTDIKWRVPANMLTKLGIGEEV